MSDDELQKRLEQAEKALAKRWAKKGDEFEKKADEYKLRCQREADPKKAANWKRQEDYNRELAKRARSRSIYFR